MSVIKVMIAVSVGSTTNVVLHLLAFIASNMSSLGLS